MSFKRAFEELRADTTQNRVDVPSYVRVGNQLLGTSSNIPSINLGPPSNPSFNVPQRSTSIPVVTPNFITDVIPRSRLLQSRTGTNVSTYRAQDSQRDNYLLRTGISSNYEEKSDELRRGLENPVTNNWIFDRNFYSGSLNTVRNMVSTNMFRNSDSNNETGFRGLTEFTQFLENLIQKWITITAKELQDMNAIDAQSYEFTQRMLSQPRVQVNESIRELFYRYYNDSADGNFGTIRWNSDIRHIIERVIEQIQRHFRDNPDLSNFLKLVPTLQAGRTLSVGGVHRWVSRINTDVNRDELLILFAIVMIRLPSVNVAKNNVMRDISTAMRFPIQYPTTISNERLVVSLADANLRSLFYFIPEQRRVIGIWNNVAYVRDAPDADSTRPFFWNYKTDLLRNLLVKIQIPTAIRNRRGQLHFEYLFQDVNNNLYRYLRETNPFNVSANENRMNRYYVSLTIYANRQQSVLHIPWILEGSTASNIPFDVSFFCQEFQRVLIETESGETLSDRATDVDVFYFYFMLLNDPATPIASVPLVTNSSKRVKTSRKRSNRQSNVAGIAVGAPYAGTKKEKHFLLGSLVNRFKNSAALYQVPARKLNTCLLLSLIKAQLYEYTFTDGKCTNIAATGDPRNNTCCYHVESLQNWSNIPRKYPFLELIEQKWYIKLFNPYKYHDETTYLEGSLDEIENDYWEKAAEEIWFHLENFYQKQIDYSSLPIFGQYFSDFFNVCISIYDVEMRCNRVHVITPQKKNPKQLVEQDQKISMINIVYDQGHIHPITHLRAFLKAEARKDEIRLHNYCPICDKKQIQDLRKTKKDTMDHITSCYKENSFHIGFDKERDTQAIIQIPEVKMCWRKNSRGKMEKFYACNSCFQEVHQHSLLFHNCYIQPKKNEIIADENIYVYDLECAQFIDELGLYKHECNCLYIRKVYPTTEEEKLGLYFPTEIEFIEEIMSQTKYVNSVFIAHNGGNYDIHFILRILERREIAHTYVPSPTSKHKFIQIEISDQHIRFIDFMRFVPGSLKNIAESFQIPVSKGDFPHKFNNGSHDNYIGRFPSKDTEDDYWSIKSFKSRSDEESFLQWYRGQLEIYCTCDGECTCTKMKWNFQDEIKKYCLLDVVVLAEVVKAFRQECMNFQSTNDENYPDSRIDWKAPCLDPLQFMTLPQLTIQTFVQGLLNVREPKQIASFNCKRRPNQDWKSLSWILSLQAMQTEKIYHRGNCLREYYDIETNSYMDGYCPEKNTVYVFLNCEYWACPTCFYEEAQLNEYFSIRGLYATEIRDAYDAWMHELNQLYTVVSIWEHDYAWQNVPLETQKLCSLMKPEQAFYGGRTEVFQLYANAARCDSEIQYYDVTSLYPSVYAHHPLPIGHPKHLIGSEIDKSRFVPNSSDRYFGFARIAITPVRSDLIGLLPQRDEITGRLFFPVHPMTGCWGTEEIYLAMENGYRVDEIYELYYWEKTEYSDQYLRGYVGYFLRMKQEAEGWKKLGATSDNPTDDEKETVAHQLYFQNGSLGKIRPEKVQKNAIKRQLAKLYLNALWGKFAQKSSKTQHTTVYGTQQFLEVWHDKRIQQSSCYFREISPGVYKVSYNLKEEFIEPVRHGNVFIAAKVTETARCVLHRQMLKIGPERIIYCDTDSIIFLWDRIKKLTGVGLGHWTNEYPKHFIEQVYALAPKLYSLTLHSAEQKYESFRVKGVQMTLENQERMSFERIKPLIESILRKDACPLTIAVNNFTIFTNSGNNALPYGQVYTRYNEKQVRAIITKRIVEVKENVDWETIANIRTFPLGYEGLFR